MLHKYNLKTGEYVGTFQANTDGNIPKGFTDIEPIEVNDGYYLRFLNNTWVQSKSNKGAVYYSTYDGAKVVCTTDEPLKGSFTKISPPNSYSKFDGSKWVEDAKMKLEFERKKANDKTLYVIIEYQESSFSYSDLKELVTAKTLLETSGLQYYYLRGIKLTLDDIMSILNLIIDKVNNLGA